MNTKPDLTRVWASDAPPGNIIDPDVTTPGKVAAGWEAELPPFEHFNFLQKWFTQGLAYFNEQGVAIWDADTAYPLNALAKGIDGKLYKAIATSTGLEPSANASKWKLIEFETVSQAEAEAGISTTNRLWTALRVKQLALQLFTAARIQTQALPLFTTTRIDSLVSAANILNKLKTVDGLGSGLNADLLDGKDAADFWSVANVVTSLNFNGYVILPNGLIIQWAEASVATDGSSPVTFPLTFPTRCLNVQVTLNHAFSTTNDAGVSAYNYSSTGCTLRNGSSTGTALKYIAIGH